MNYEEGPGNTRFVTGVRFNVSKSNTNPEIVTILKNEITNNIIEPMYSRQ